MRQEAHPPYGLDPYARWLFLAANFRELRKGEVPRAYLLGTRVNKEIKGWVTGKPTSSSGTEKELLREGSRPTPPIP
jgi:hypothetical protein